MDLMVFNLASYTLSLLLVRKENGPLLRVHFLLLLLLLRVLSNLWIQKTFHCVNLTTTNLCYAKLFLQKISITHSFEISNMILFGTPFKGSKFVKR